MFLSPTSTPLTIIVFLLIEGTASVLQAVQPFFVMALSPVFGFIWLRMRSRQPSSPAKFALALVLVGLGMFLLVPAAKMAQEQNIKVSVWWLIGVYFLHTMGELCLSPIGLSVVTKLAPPRIVGMMMGVWFLSISVGNKAAGYAAGLFDKMPLPKLFGSVGVMTAGAGLILFALTPSIKKMMSGVR